MFFWKKNKIIDAFAADLASEFYSYVQPDIMRTYLDSMDSSSKQQDKKKKKRMRQTAESMHNVIRQVQHFRATHNLGVYGKARFQLKFDERLLELGYEPEVVEKIKKIMLTHAEEKL